MEKSEKKVYDDVMSSKNNINNRLMKQASIASLSVALVLILLKTVAFVITGSVAVLSGLFDSVQDLMTSFVNMIAVKHATEPADKDHRFGHGKAQGVGSLVQAMIIAASAVFLLIESVEHFFRHQTVAHPAVGVVLTGVALLMTVVLVRFQTFVIQQTGALSIKADRTHYTGDILMNVGIIVSVIISYYTGWVWLDSLFGIGVAGYLLVVVWQIVRESVQMLMDCELSEEIRAGIKKIIHSFPEVLALHDLKTRQSGSNIFIQCCIHLPDTMTLRQAHNISDMIEDRIKELLPNADIIIHTEPERSHQ